MRWMTALIIVALLSVVGCDQNGKPCDNTADDRVKVVLFERCMELSASKIPQHTSSNSEVHETVKQCSSYAYVTSAYNTCDMNERVTLEWLKEQEESVTEVDGQ